MKVNLYKVTKQQAKQILLYLKLNYRKIMLHLFINQVWQKYQ